MEANLQLHTGKTSLADYEEDLALINSQIAILEERRAALRQLIEVYSGKRTMIRKHVVPTTYSKDLLIRDKVLFVIHQLKEGTAHDVAAKLLELDKATFKSREKTEKVCRENLSRLSKAGLLGHARTGYKKQYIYFVIQ